MARDWNAISSGTATKTKRDWNIINQSENTTTTKKRNWDAVMSTNIPIPSNIPSDTFEVKSAPNIFQNALTGIANKLKPIADTFTKYATWNEQTANKISGPGTAPYAFGEGAARALQTPFSAAYGFIKGLLKSGEQKNLAEALINPFRESLKSAYATTPWDKSGVKPTTTMSQAVGIDENKHPFIAGAVNGASDAISPGAFIKFLREGKSIEYISQQAARTIEKIEPAVKETAKLKTPEQIKYSTYREAKTVRPEIEPVTQVKYSTAREPVLNVKSSTMSGKEQQLLKSFDEKIRPEEIDDIINQTQKAVDDIRKNHVENFLKKTSGKGIEPGTTYKDLEGNVVGKQGRISLNDKWYQDYFKENGRYPSETEFNKIANKQLKEGFEGSDGFIPPDEVYTQGLERVKTLQSLKQKMYSSTQQIGEGVPTIKTLRLKGQPKITTEQVGQKISVSKPMRGSEAKAAAETEELLSTADKWKDKPTVSYIRETFKRNLEDVAGPEAPKLIEKYATPIEVNETARIKFLNKERAEISSLGIKAGSEESELLQQLGEGLIDEKALRQYTKDPEKIINANKVLRAKYDAYLDALNGVLEKNGYSPIPKRKDYFRHFEDVTSTIEQFGIPVRENKLPTDINGLTADFRPGKNFFASALQRKGTKTTYDAIKGIDGYINGASKVIYHTDDIQRLRAFDKAIRSKYEGTTQLSNFAKNITEYTNILAGKKAMLDRAVESTVGRTIYGLFGRLKKQVGSNMVGLNIGSALTNFIPITQSLATTSKKAFVKGMLETLGNMFKNDGFIEKSGFLTRRIGSDPLAMNFYDKVSSKAGWLFKNIDNFTAQTIVRSKYLEGLEKGLSETQALKKADDWADRVMADRSLGSMPTLFDSKSVGALTQFQLEVNNQLSFLMKDIPRNFDKAGAASAISQMLVYGYLFNELFEKATGRRPAFDPIGVVQQAYEDFTDKDTTAGQATQKTIKNIVDQLPFSDLLTGTGGRIPIGAALPSLTNIAVNAADIAAGDISGKKGLQNIGKELLKPAMYVLPPTGGGQAKKTVEGLTTVLKGGTYDTSKEGYPRLKYPVKKTPENIIKGAIFGKSALPETIEYYKENRRALSELQTAQLKVMNDYGISQEDTYKGVLLNRKLGKAETDADKKAVKIEIVEHYNNTGDFGVFLDSVPQTIEVEQIKHDLSQAEYTELLGTIAGYIKQQLDYMKNIDKYKKADTALKYNFLNGAIAGAKTQAVNEFKQQIYKNGR
jgi:hypothetical protein